MRTYVGPGLLPPRPPSPLGAKGGPRNTVDTTDNIIEAPMPHQPRRPWKGGPLEENSVERDKGLAKENPPEDKTEL